MTDDQSRGPGSESATWTVRTVPWRVQRIEPFPLSFSAAFCRRRRPNSAPYRRRDHVRRRRRCTTTSRWAISSAIPTSSTTGCRSSRRRREQHRRRCILSLAPTRRTAARRTRLAQSRRRWGSSAARGRERRRERRRAERTAILRARTTLDGPGDLPLAPVAGIYGVPKSRVGAHVGAHRTVGRTSTVRTRRQNLAGLLWCRPQA